MPTSAWLMILADSAYGGASLTGSDEQLENAYWMRMAGRFSRCLRAYAKAHGIPVLGSPPGERKHELAEEYRAQTRVTQGLFLVLVGRAQAPVGDVKQQPITSSGRNRCPT